MTNVQKLKKVSPTTLKAVRMRLGGVDENDASNDDEINKMTADEIVKHYAAWYLGNGSWWSDMKHIFDKIK